MNRLLYLNLPMACLVILLILLFVIVFIIMKYSGWNVLRQVVSISLSVVMFLGSCLFVLDVSSNFGTMTKPVVYLYPKEEMNIDVKLSNPDSITCDYPEYGDGWNVVAKPSGDLKELNSDKNLYCLYYEASMPVLHVEDEGFVVKSADTADFLDEKLEILGLNDKERNEFIIYWLPRLEANKYNYIRFLTNDEMNDVQKLSVNPKPDTVIRIMMSYKGLDRPINVREQKLKTAARAGFTVVEWGGTEIK